jgi:hypothetical protein
MRWWPQSDSDEISLVLGYANIFNIQTVSGGWASANLDLFIIEIY